MRARRTFLSSLLAASLFVPVLGTAAGGQQQQQRQQTAGPPQTPQPGQRGRGRGRGPAQVMTLFTPAWRDGGMIPEKHAQPGAEISPPLTWMNAPADTQSFVLMVHDLDAITVAGDGRDYVLHWLVWNIPPDRTSLPEGLPAVAELPDGTRQISATGPEYRGPGAPASGPPHHYLFELYALDTMLTVPAVGVSPSETRAAIVAAMTGHIRGKAALFGIYRRDN